MKDKMQLKYVNIQHIHSTIENLSISPSQDVLANTENSVDRLVELGQETYLCPSTTGYLMPLRAINTAGKWRIVVNGVKAHYETLTQTARVEECSTAGSPCPLVPECYETKCVQKSLYHR